MPTPQERTKQDAESRFVVDRTYSIDVLADLFGKPYMQDQMAFPRFILPGADWDKIDWIIDNFEAVEGELVKNRATGQWYVKYDHDPGKPDDALHSFNYNWLAQFIDAGSDIWLKSF